tara:strand:- start:485 stop:688 length:204 start_codon:yes stop_codon:yes gene_type:complete
MKNKTKIEINAEDTIARVDGIEIGIKEINEQDHEGHCWLWMELEDGQEFISYDEGETWDNIDWGGCW